MRRKQKKNTAIIFSAVLVAVAAILGIIFGGSNGSQTATGEIVINEIMAANNQSVPDNYGEYSDWVELYNTTSAPINLSGWGLSDSKTVAARWVFPDITIPSGGYILVFCSGRNISDAKAQYQHTNFKLAAAGESVVLTNASGSIVDIIDYTLMSSNVSLGRESSNIHNFVKFDKATPGFANTDEGYAQYLDSIKTDDSPLMITELMASNVTTIKSDYDEYCDWIEIFNSGDTDINLFGYGLTDDANDLMKWRFPDVTIGAGEYLVIYCDKRGVSADGTNEYLHSNFALSSYAETVSLCSVNGRVLDTVTYSGLDKDMSYAFDIATETWNISMKPTPGYPNTEAGFSDFIGSALTPQGSIVINEIALYNEEYVKTKSGEYYDWIELKNISDQDINLAGWGLTNNTGNPAKWTFPEETIKAGDTLIVLCSGLNLKNKTTGYMHTNFRLSMQGEIVALFNAEGEFVDRINAVDVPYTMSYGRMTGTNAFFYFESPSPGRSNSDGATGIADMPSVDIAAGTYRGEQQVTLSTDIAGGRIYYTTDGSTPTRNSTLYSGPITINESVALRARVFAEGLIGSATMTNTYFIDSPHTIAIVSLVTDPDNLFSKDKGIYVVGNGSNDPDTGYRNANFWNDWERPVHFEYFDENGDLGLSMDGGIKIFGAYSRMRNQKGFSIWARAHYGTETLDYPFFDSRPYTQYKSIVLRAGANDCDMAKIRDVLMTDLVREYTTLDVQAFTPCVVYINGDYWGVYFIREKINKHYIAQHYNIEDPENIDLIVGNNRALVGDNSDYKEMISYITSNDITRDDVYARLCDWMDTENFADWCISEMYYNNADLGNIKYWRERTEDGKYRWILYDFCWGMYNVHLDGVARLTNPAGMGTGQGISTVLLRTLLKNSDFRAMFIDRFAYHLNNTFKQERVLNRITEIADMIDSEMTRDKERWRNGSYNSWRNTQIKRLSTWVEDRHAYILTDIQQYFNLSDSEMLDKFGALGTK